MIKTVVNLKQCGSLNCASLSLNFFFSGVLAIGMAPGEPEALWRLVSDKIMKRYLDSLWRMCVWPVGNDSRDVENNFLFKGLVNMRD